MLVCDVIPIATYMLCCQISTFSSGKIAVVFACALLVRARYIWSREFLESRWATREQEPYRVFWRYTNDNDDWKKV